MENFVYEYPTKVYFGKGAARQHLANILSAYGPNVLLAYGMAAAPSRRTVFMRRSPVF